MTGTMVFEGRQDIPEKLRERDALALDELLGLLDDLEEMTFQVEEWGRVLRRPVGPTQQATKRDKLRAVEEAELTLTRAQKAVLCEMLDRIESAGGDST